MCGIAGVLHLDGTSVDPELLRAMATAVAHRGPDGAGWYAEDCAGLANRRLAVIDLSDAGQQPMASKSGAVVVTYNGEIYNFRELRRELESYGHRFGSATDTEVVIHAYQQWGIECVSRFEGMFAFALWDRSRKRLLLVRDRFGIKPLYWTQRGDRLVFASEVKSLIVHPDVRVALCPEALDEYLTFQNVFSDRTLFEGVSLLPAGCLLVCEADGAPRVSRWWDYEFGQEPEPSDEELREAFVAAVRRQLVGDVPIGAYLSGGLDSGSIVSVMRQSLPRICTFTGGFDLSSATGLELGFDERREAESLANHLQTEHYEVVLHAGDMEWVIPSLVWQLEDLRVGQSYPNYYVARLASRFVKVALSGAGGDELFAGYPWRYHRGNGGDFLRSYYDYWQRLTRDEDKAKLFAPSLRRELAGHSTYDVFRGVFDGWRSGYASVADRVDAALYFELKTFLHGLLVVEDKLSMAHGLETRVPFLDERLVALALSVPPGRKLRDLEHATFVDENEAGKRLRYEQMRADGKMVLRSAMAPLLPVEHSIRPKQGFSAPDASWFRGPSIAYVDRVLRDPNASIYEWLERAYVEHILDEHESGRVNRRLLIWSLLCLESWCKIFLEGHTDYAVAPPRRDIATL